MKEILAKLLNHEELSREEMKTILIGITHSEYPNEQITALLTCLQMRGVTSCSLTATSTSWAQEATAKTPSTSQPPLASSLLEQDTRWRSTATMPQRRSAARRTSYSTMASNSPMTSTASTVRSTRRASSIYTHNSSPRQ